MAATLAAEGSEVEDLRNNTNNGTSVQSNLVKGHITTLLK